MVPVINAVVQRLQVPPTIVRPVQSSQDAVQRQAAGSKSGHQLQEKKRMRREEGFLRGPECRPPGNARLAQLWL